MLGSALLIHISIGALSWLFGGTDNLYEPSPPAMALIVILWLTIAIGSYFRYLDVRAGGAVLARRFGAVHASDRSRFAQEKMLLNVVAETAIAASCPQPEVFVLRTEPGVNAFVVGSERGGFVIVVTQGALDALDRDQLQAVVAHEFGHIVHGDVPINMRLLIALGGLLAIDELGCLLRGKHPDEYAHFGVLLGYLLIAIGSIGVFFGSVIRAAFSRQREYLADASAVQFTRNPDALTEALSIIRDQFPSVALQSNQSGEFAHLCFHLGKDTAWYRRLFATHPSLQSRMDAIDPHFAIKTRAKRNFDDRRGAGSSGVGGYEGMSQPLSREINASDTGLPDRIALLLPDTTSCLAVLFAIFASDDRRQREEFFSAIAFAYNKIFANQVRETVDMLDQELQQDQLGIINHATEHLRSNVKRENRQRLLLNLERLLIVEGEFSLINYATLQLVRRKLDAEFPILHAVSGAHPHEADGRRIKTFDNMGQEFALLLSLIVESSGAPAADIEAEFDRVLKCYTQVTHPRRTSTESGIVKELEQAFHTLLAQPLPIRQAFVQHCVEIMHRDGHIAHAEQSLLDLFAASLECEVRAA